jgi:sugar O-acyltransferase (sialic acid O-acetyltransferase NeuD family)
LSNAIFVIGAGGHAKVVISVLRATGKDVAVIFDDDERAKGQRILDVPVAGSVADLDPSEFAGGVIAIGKNSSRAKIAARLTAKWLVAIHPTAYVDPTVRIGPGTVVFAGAIIQPETIIGEHVIINTGATIDHDCVIGDFAHIAPGVQLAGDVHVGTGTLLGIGTVAIPGIRVGARATVGAGSVLVRNIADETVAFGNPARAARPQEGAR